MTKRRLAIRALLTLLTVIIAPVAVLLTVAALPPQVEQGARVRAWLSDAEYLGMSGVRLQQNRSDCGVAALEMLVEVAGRDPKPIAPWHETVRTRHLGMSMLEMQRVARSLGVATHGVKANLASVRRVPLPAIVHFDDHYMVLDRIDATGAFQLRDPASGRIRMEASAFQAQFQGEMLALGTPTINRVATR
jgi:ABC-type bacteriocin/lantibiotic exporter with double-glycine peptidase domain